jgi:hypothetical protein
VKSEPSATPAAFEMAAVGVESIPFSEKRSTAAARRALRF